jgi:gluconokinase
MIVVVMGVSGSGKTTIGMMLADRVGAVFADADDYHPATNKQKMAAGHPLNDEDRQPWLEVLNRLMKEWFAEGKSGVLACSALKASYRVTLQAGMPDGAVRFVVLEASTEMLAARLAERKHEFMSAKLLESQLATLEIPSDAVRVVNDRSPKETVEQILAQISPGKN